MRNRVEGPGHLSGEHVIGTDIAGRREEGFTGRRSQNDQILEDAPGRVGLYAADGGRIAAQPLTQINEAVLAKRQNGFAGAGVDLLDVVVDLEDQPAIGAVLAFPVVDAAGRDPSQVCMNPDLLAGAGWASRLTGFPPPEARGREPLSGSTSIRPRRTAEALPDRGREFEQATSHIDRHGKRCPPPRAETSWTEPSLSPISRPGTGSSGAAGPDTSFAIARQTVERRLRRAGGAGDRMKRTRRRRRRHGRSSRGRDRALRCQRSHRRQARKQRARKRRSWRRYGRHRARSSTERRDDVAARRNPAPPGEHDRPARSSADDAARNARRLVHLSLSTEQRDRRRHDWRKRQALYLGDDRRPRCERIRGRALDPARDLRGESRPDRGLERDRPSRARSRTARRPSGQAHDRARPRRRPARLAVLPDARDLMKRTRS